MTNFPTQIFDTHSTRSSWLADPIVSFFVTFENVRLKVQILKTENEMKTHAFFQRFRTKQKKFDLTIVEVAKTLTERGRKRAEEMEN